jgi:ethanolamine ammonia-lyase small subunit
VRPEILVLLVSTLSASLGAHADSCDDASALATARKFVDKVVLSPDCAAGLKEFDVDEHWIQECDRLKGPHQELYAEFSRRTKARVDTIHTPKEGHTFAIIRFTGPDHAAFLVAVNEADMCAAGRNSLLASAPELQGREEKDFWAGIPVKEYPGGLPLECRKDHWAIASPR